MICSMTGFGQANRSFAGYKVFIDVKSVNHRYSEVSIRMPKEWAVFEDALKKTVLQAVKRGRVDVFVTAEREAASMKSVTVDFALADAYLQASEQLRERYGYAEQIGLKDLLKLPDLVQMRESRVEPDEQLEQELCACLQEAVAGLSDMRRREGAFLEQDIRERLGVLKSIHLELEALAPHVVHEYAAKLTSRIQLLLQEQSPVDEQRLATEIAIFADRCNVDEELTRLKSHFQQCEGLLAEQEPVGRKLDFLIQEMNREVNTIGSKSNHSEPTARVITMKAELEKMREQIQNIE
ncbi:YicC/YloC family endoribonuclease [Paenibacillus sp. N3.4]|uniref:YicC/YloC family endoribonuclease n=1 Tax=Paenibacillus sp. N3.4 TaxID=2603222 RepID=UPI0011CBBCF9|nr:YicC/YloC family endoribonuclease [Paenibacillus sp. N3.4]TXK85699.1 YicC family protein [Paenibacillus sp. N3.4]